MDLLLFLFHVYKRVSGRLSEWVKRCYKKPYKTCINWFEHLNHDLYHHPETFFNRPGVPEAVLQTPSSLIKTSFSSKSSKCHKSQTRRAKELIFWENVHPPQHVTCHISRVTCHMSRVTCHISCVTCQMSCVTFFFFYKVV